MISIECSKCQRKLRVPDDAAGKTAKCPCGEPLRVPHAQPLPPQNSTPVPASDLQYFSHKCDCGRTLRVAKNENPKMAKCPCGSTFSVPRLGERHEETNLAKAIPLAKPAFTLADRPFPEMSSYQAPPVSYRGEINANIGSAPIRTEATSGAAPSNRAVASSYLERARQETSNGSNDSEGGYSNFFDATVIGGLVVMLAAVAWFVAGLAAGVIFFYPPVMFVLGMITVVKGIASND